MSNAEYFKSIITINGHFSMPSRMIKSLHWKKAIIDGKTSFLLFLTSEDRTTGDYEIILGGETAKEVWYQFTNEKATFEGKEFAQ